MPPRHHAFLDESPALPDKDNFFLISLLATETSRLTSLRRLPKRVRNRLMGKKLRQVRELKFYHSDDRVRRGMLERIARGDVQVVVYVVDKEGRQVEDTPLNYGMVVGSAAATYLNEVHPQLRLTVDKKYTSPGGRKAFDGIVERLVAAQAPEGTFTLTAHAESHGGSLIQLADFVAGAAHHKYNRGDPSYFDLIEEKVVLERTVSWTAIKAAAIKELGG